MTTPDTATIERAYRVRLSPTPAQQRTLRRLFGARRFVWNWALMLDRQLRAAGERSGVTAWSSAFTALKRTPEAAWLAELPREPFNQTLRDLERAKKNFAAGRARSPRRKRFGTVNSARFTLDQRRQQVTLGERRGEVQIDGLGRVRFRRTEAMVGRLRSVTVSLDAAGRWFASFTADGVPAPQAVPASRPAVGIDLGLTDTAVMSDGTRVAASRSLAKKRKRLRRYQRSYARGRDAQLRAMGLDPTAPIPKGTRVPSSKRMLRRKARIGRLHAQSADARRDHQHQLTARAVAVGEVVCLEDLSVKAMGRSMRRGFRRSVADAGLGEVKRQLGYKAAWHGRVVSVVDRFYPSSKTCGACGAVNAGLRLGDRDWTCPACATPHDRDENAAHNIEREGLRLLAGSTCPDGPTPRSGGRKARGADACAAGESPPTGQPTAVKRELDHCAASRRPRTGVRDGPRAKDRVG